MPLRRSNFRIDRVRRLLCILRLFFRDLNLDFWRFVSDVTNTDVACTNPSDAQSHAAATIVPENKC